MRGIPLPCAYICILLHCSREHKDQIIIPLAFGPGQAACDLHTERQSIILIAVDADSFAMDCPACVGQTVRLSVCQSIWQYIYLTAFLRSTRCSSVLGQGKARQGEVGPK